MARRKSCRERRRGRRPAVAQHRSEYGGRVADAWLVNRAPVAAVHSTIRPRLLRERLGYAEPVRRIRARWAVRELPAASTAASHLISSTTRAGTVHEWHPCAASRHGWHPYAVPAAVAAAHSEWEEKAGNRRPEVGTETDAYPSKLVISSSRFGADPPPGNSSKSQRQFSHSVDCFYPVAAIHVAPTTALLFKILNSQCPECSSLGTHCLVS